MEQDRLRLLALPLAALVGLGTAAVAQDTYAQTPVWEENFNGSSIDGNNWTYDVGTGCQVGICGWGNAEMQYYTSRPQNARIENGNLVIEAHRENFEGSPFTSARLKTEGRMHFRYGTLEARIRLPDVGNGLWPAYWMLGAIGVWPQRGEIDIMEAGNVDAINAGLANRRIGAAVHWDIDGNYAMHYDTWDSPVDLNNDFHTYRLTWDPEYIRVSIDGNQYFEFFIGQPALDNASLQEFHQQHFLLLNMAVGGTYTGITAPAGITAPLPGRMEIDYIRLYQDHPDSQLYIGNESAAPAGRFGVFTEQSGLAGALQFGNDAELYLWNNLTPIASAPYEGGELMAFRAAAGEWFGAGILTDIRNMSNYAGGNLKLHMRTTTPHVFKIGISTSFGDSWIDFVDGGQQYGLVRDGNWHEVTIPFDAFHDLDLHSVKQMFMVVGDPPGSDVELFIDNVYYESP
ncbi:glycoside hydrolase family 16 protein [Luteimonas abyssi]|uniref:glycoside hydrolase family 16 protein n=1 Tax=Luteimonas abyssi TaxID=1247514 RepID=UPI000737BFD2|nr:glycoside hydrolase family 16 protein [Luteimonas abyssi]